MQDLLIVPSDWSTAESTGTAIAEGCVAYYTGIPPVLEPIAQADGWTVPCVITEDDTGAISAWRAI